MNVKRTTVRTRRTDVPYNTRDKTATLKFWEKAAMHTGVTELRAKRGGPAKAIEDRKNRSRCE
jgi:hypothetical protein